MSGYSGQARPEVIPYVPDWAREVLDIGCANGEFGRALMEDRAGTITMDGIEADAKAARTAASIYREVVTGFYPDVFHNRTYDAIVCNDVLEHMFDPWTAVSKMRDHLRPGGVVVASIPNMRHWSALRALLLDARWDYQDHGIFDRTHLRWFTRATMQELFTDAGFSIQLIEPVELPQPTRLWWRLGKVLAPRQTGDLLTKQYIIVAAAE